MKYWHMTKPRFRDDIESVSIYNGYFLLHCKSGGVYKAKSCGYTTQESTAIEDINHLTKVSDIENDIKELKARLKAKLDSIPEIEEKIKNLEELLNTVKGEQQ